MFMMHRANYGACNHVISLTLEWLTYQKLTWVWQILWAPSKCDYIHEIIYYTKTYQRETTPVETFSGNQHHRKWTKEVCVLSAVSQFLFLLCAASGKAIASTPSATLTQTEQPLYNVSSFLKIFQNTTAAKIESLREPIIVNILEENTKLNKERQFKAIA